MSHAAITASSTSRFVTTKLHRLHYHEAGSGQPVVMLHGSGPGATAWSNFNSNIAPLSSQFRVLAFDMPGWGDTEDLDPAGSSDHVEALVLALDELDIDRAVLIGNSMGGMTTIRFTIEHPDRVSHLIPMGSASPGTNLFSPAGLSEGLKALFEGYRDPSPENFKKIVSVMAFDEAFGSEALAQERSANALAHPEHLERYLRGSFGPAFERFFGLESRLPDISCPTLVVHGRDDRAVNYEHSLRLVSAIPDARLLLFNRCGHWAQLEHAAEFNRVVEQFILNH